VSNILLLFRIVLQAFEDHNREELEALRKLALLDIQDPKKHDDLVWKMIKMEYFERKRMLENSARTKVSAKLLSKCFSIAFLFFPMLG